MGWTATAPGEPWQVRVGTGDGTATGAGFVVDRRRVVTAAHVVEAARRYDGAGDGSPVRVQAAGGPGAARWATVATGSWFPAGEGDGVDLAVLDVDGPLDAATPAFFRLAPIRGRPIRLAGYPVGTAGAWVRGALAGPERGPWLPLDVEEGPFIGPTGFGGAAVVDDGTGLVIGMAVSGAGRRGGWWMLPVEAFLAHLHPRAEVRGAPAVDAALADGALDGHDDPHLDHARPLARWLGGRGLRRVRLVATGQGPGEGAPGGPLDLGQVRRAVLRRLVVLADRERRPPPGHPARRDAPRATVPPVGGIDLAIDASGLALDVIARRIADRFGVAAGGPQLVATGMAGAAGATLVIDGVDDAEQPGELVDEVLGPLAEGGVRLLLGFHRPWSAAWEQAQARWPDHDLDDDDPSVVAHRLDVLIERVAHIAEREDALLRRRTSVALRIASVPGVPPRAAALRLRLAALRKTARGPDWAWLLPQLEGCESAADRVAARLDQLDAELDALLERRAELRSRLDGDRLRAAAAGENRRLALAALYRDADEELNRSPCDLVAAAELVARFHREVDGEELAAGPT